MDSLLLEIEKIAREAGKLFLRAQGDKQVSEKSGRRDLVTRYDREVQRYLERALPALLPEAGFLGEEEDPRGRDREYLFVVDPIDGTTNFVKDLRHSAVSIALTRNGESVLGVIYNPYRDELYRAAKGGGAFLNGAPIHISDEPPEDALALLGLSPYYPELTGVTFALARRLFDVCLDLRRGGSAALDLCEVAAGRAGCYFECRLSPWDYAAGELIVREAGGFASDMTGAPLSIDRKCSVAAANQKCYEFLLAAAKDCGFR